MYLYKYFLVWSRDNPLPQLLCSMWQINVNKIRINNIVRVFRFFVVGARCECIKRRPWDWVFYNRNWVFKIGFLRRAARVDFFTFSGYLQAKVNTSKMNIYRVLYIIRLYVQSVCRWRVGGDFSFESYTYVSGAWLDAWTTDNGSSPATNTNHEPRGWMHVAPRWHGKGSDRPHPTRRDHAQSTRWASWGWGSTDPWSGYVGGRSEVLFVIDVVVVVVWWWMVSESSWFEDVGDTIKVELSFDVCIWFAMCVQEEQKEKYCLLCFLN